MPDGDVISSRVQHRWRSTLSRLRGGATPLEVAVHANRALSDTFRRYGGIGGSAAYGAIIEARGRGELSPSETRQRAHRIYRSQEQTEFALLAFRAVKRLLASPPKSAAALEPGTITVAQAVCAELLNAELFERVRPHLVGDVFPDHEAFDRFVEHCHALLTEPIAHISASLTLHPTATGLRAAPTRRRKRRQATATILDQSIL